MNLNGIMAVILRYISDLCLVITSLTSGPVVVTHDFTPGQLIVSSLLSNITADRRLLFVNTATVTVAHLSYC